MVFGDSVLKGVIYENNIYKVSQNRFFNICEDILGVSIENKAKFGYEVGRISMKEKTVTFNKI